MFGIHFSKVISRDGKIPKFLFNAIEFIEKNGIAQEGLFRVNGNLSFIESVTKLIDQGVNVNFNEYNTNENDIHNVAGIIKYYLRQRPETLVPDPVFAEFMKAADMEDIEQRDIQLKKTIEMLPRENLIVFRRVLELFRKVEKMKEKNKMTFQNCATVIAPTLLSPEDNDPLQIVKTTKSVNTIFEYLLSNYGKFYPEGLWESAKSGHLPSLQEGIDKLGLGVNGCDNEGKTALHYAVEAAHKEIIDYLLEKNADTDIQDNKGDTPLHTAVFKENKELVMLLVSAGASINLSNKKGVTPLKMAEEKMPKMAEEMEKLFQEIQMEAAIEEPEEKKEEVVFVESPMNNVSNHPLDDLDKEGSALLSAQNLKQPRKGTATAESSDLASLKPPPFREEVLTPPKQETNASSNKVKVLPSLVSPREHTSPPSEPPPLESPAGKAKSPRTVPQEEDLLDALDDILTTHANPRASEGPTPESALDRESMALSAPASVAPLVYSVDMEGLNFCTNSSLEVLWTLEPIPLNNVEELPETLFVFANKLNQLEFGNQQSLGFGAALKSLAQGVQNFLKELQTFCENVPEQNANNLKAVSLDIKNAIKNVIPHVKIIGEVTNKSQIDRLFASKKKMQEYVVLMANKLIHTFNLMKEAQEANVSNHMKVTAEGIGNLIKMKKSGVNDSVQLQPVYETIINNSFATSQFVVCIAMCANHRDIQQEMLKEVSDIANCAATYEENINVSNFNPSPQAKMMLIQFKQIKILFAKLGNIGIEPLGSEELLAQVCKEFEQFRFDKSHLSSPANNLQGELMNCTNKCIDVLKNSTIQKLTDAKTVFSTFEEINDCAKKFLVILERTAKIVSDKNLQNRITSLSDALSFHLRETKLNFIQCGLSIHSDTVPTHLGRTLCGLVNVLMQIIHFEYFLFKK